MEFGKATGFRSSGGDLNVRAVTTDSGKGCIHTGSYRRLKQHVSRPQGHGRTARR